MGGGDISPQQGGGLTAPNQLRNIVVAEARVVGVMAAGDLVYGPGGSGSRRGFEESYHPSWGQFKGKTWPTPGNHEVVVPHDTGGDQYDGYDWYFANPNLGPNLSGTTAMPWTGPSGFKQPGATGTGSNGGRWFWRRNDELGWAVISIDSDRQAWSGTIEGSPQYTWLVSVLNEIQSRQLKFFAFWHHPPFTGGDEFEANMTIIWNLLNNARCDFVLTGHDHSYGRFHPSGGGGVRAGTAAPGGAAPGGIIQYRIGNSGHDTNPLDTQGQAVAAGTPAGVYSVGKWFLSPTGYWFEAFGQNGSRHDSLGANNSIVRSRRAP
jgi:hypothetical protein